MLPWGVVITMDANMCVYVYMCVYVCVNELI